MTRKNRTPEETAQHTKTRELLQESNISGMEDIQNLFQETIEKFMENGLDEKMGYRLCGQSDRFSAAVNAVFHPFEYQMGGKYLQK